ncbi:apolipoprotein N-acyltransferase [Bacteroides reticulotermitis JCM 10512]|uniref:Apolipoprotein N-acyltransferase n=1 Tax=Bacteroides reticulotermitis JCM 10512 TaxID=1445607 RepID=W4UR35_9BACE|nr:apolipoprotein N-acyltransferase [Bacteroides reticulotermitis JCM 10512]
MSLKISKGMQTSDSIVIIPTYNERENIENIIRAVFGLEKFFMSLSSKTGRPMVLPEL